MKLRRVPGGICSNHLCDPQARATVQLTGPFGATFLLPQDADSHLMIVRTGTGITPFRGFLEQRLSATPAHRGRMLLFYGARTCGEMPYLDRLRQLPLGRVKQQLCFSRMADQPKTYVQDRLLAKAASLSALLRDDARHLFVCGLKGMEAGIHVALAQVCTRTGLDWPNIRSQMVATGRFHMETY